MGIVNEHRMRRRKRKRKTFFLSILILLFLCFIFLQVSRIKSIKVIGCSRYTQEDIIEIVKKNTVYDNTVYLYLNYRYGEPKQVPFIEYLDVKMTGINTLTVRVYEKAIFGCVKYLDHYMYFDKDGIVVDSSSERYEGIPVVTGLVIDSVILSEKLTIQKDKLFDLIKNITQLIHKYEVKINTIHFDSEDAISLYSEDITILLGKREMYDEQIAELVNILPKLKGKKGILHLENFVTGNKTYFEISK